MAFASRRPKQMTARSNQRFDSLSRRALRSLLLPVVVICISGMAGLLLVSLTAVQDLADLTPRFAQSDDYVLLEWRKLQRGRSTPQQGGFSSGARVRDLGYMMEGDAPLT